MSAPLRLLLASASPARLATLRAAGVDPLVRVSGVDEDAALRAARARFGELDPSQVALVLARAKAEAVAWPSAAATDDEGSAMSGSDLDPGYDLVLGCDSVLELDGEAYGKPATPEQARERWALMSGRSGVLHTGHWLIDVRDDTPDIPPDAPADAAGDAPAMGTGTGAGATLGATGSTTVHFGRLSPAEIHAYVATGEPLHVAGAFTVDGLGGPYVERIDGDYHNVVGLSLPLLRGLLAELDLPWHALTSPPATAQ